ncbi:SDR family oxidoreductase [Nonlabens ulvanivorans]|uniref:Short-chain dehydrogenase n=1 Tax=Nonlabens ulvanivorans TaxID=906888 RepID=A0A084JXB2_NONUL|nr:SDR family oxidoreductase [Nonlabens ulvanivorans]KEZ93596.1 short-chain dehydrogenase [Nonlabens ulvanivorans]PRX14181.1 short-subunit dehydrogenase [Nonlabens ulvanivorans]
MNKVVLVTGGSSGIGKSISIYLKSKGYTVYGTSRNPGSYPDSPIDLVAMDVKDPISIEKAVAEIINKEGKIDILINNAGVGITGPVEETPIEEIHGAMDTNFYGPLRVLQAVLPYMRKQQSGRVINITSIAGYMGLPYRGIYSASKGALEIVTEAYRMECAHLNIHFSNVAPGDFATNIAAGRFHAPVVEGSDYATGYSQTLKLIDEHVDDGSDPMEVAYKIYDVLQEKNPGIHYKVGSFLQKFSIVLKKILPEKRYEKMLKKHYKL